MTVESRALELYVRPPFSNKKSKKYAVTTVTSGIGEESGCIRPWTVVTQLATPWMGEHNTGSRYHCAYAQHIASALIIRTTKVRKEFFSGSITIGSTYHTNGSRGT
jgi:hypothetical protein